MDWLSQLYGIGEVAVAMLLGGIIGLERELADKPAGFRTHMLVAGASAMLVVLSDAMAVHFDTSAGEPLIRSDPLRIVQAIITGISFLGAGTIIRRHGMEHVEGLTTAATILLSSAMGISVAVNQIVLAVGVTVLALIVLRGIRILEQKLGMKKDA